MMQKYPIHKLAKDLKKDNKEFKSQEIMDILTKYGHPPKNHMQPLTNQELSIIFEYLTQHNQIDSIQSVYADVYHEPAQKAESAAPKAEEKKAQPAAKPADHSQNSKGGKPAQASQPAAPKAEEKKPQQPAKPMSRVPEKKVVDTRGGGNVNLAKYDDPVRQH